jgi:hypothetical protein
MVRSDSPSALSLVWIARGLSTLLAVAGHASLTFALDDGMRVRSGGYQDHDRRSGD